MLRLPPREWFSGGRRLRTLKDTRSEMMPGWGGLAIIRVSYGLNQDLHKAAEACGVGDLVSNSYD